ncbi:hypothetical protein HNP84_000207 [Thermocatellispora tengchongensis]|uniref:Uncharacterized protein n=1 Tax=Thermocatellispora tengchongensis TaxID=1073253 RepID=A0A840NUP0_9ACTN|nr:hypothetical protein [Thermocatellispora tengchongensis]MBB5130519.1 hypothetical protein [Thermocatellispora tengchongensis]
MTTAYTPTRHEPDALRLLQGVEIGNDIISRRRPPRTRDYAGLGVCIHAPDPDETAAARRTAEQILDRLGYSPTDRAVVLEALGFISTARKTTRAGAA